MSERHLFLAEVEEALGPGLDYGHDPERGLHVRSARGGSLWLGVDRAFLVDSDDGRGRRLPLLVALPASSSPGARVEVELVGAFEGPDVVLVGRLPGCTVPVDPILRAAARIDGSARWVGDAQAAEMARTARRAFRERRSHGRITGGLAWLPPDDLPSSAASSLIYSEAERALDRLPPRYLRGLEGVLDPDERLHVSIQRPWRTEAGVVSRLRGEDRRSGLLLLTDREVLWVTDHFNPDSFLSDWGVDVELLPVERLTAVRVDETRVGISLVFEEPNGRLVVALPFELEREARKMASLAQRFLAHHNTMRLRRRYEAEPIEFDEEAADRFGQLAYARTLRDAASAEAGELLAFLYSPRREGQRRQLGLWLSPSEVGLVGHRRGRIPIGELAGAGMALSPLTARLSLRGRQSSIDFPYPGPLAVHSARSLRLLRRLWANSVG